MKRFVLIACFGAALSLGACETINTAISSAKAVVVNAYPVAKGALLVYRDGYQAAVLTYGRLPACDGTAVLCRDQGRWEQLKAIDAAATASIVAGNKAMHVAGGDLSSIAAMMSAIADAEVKITALGIKPKL